MKPKLWKRYVDNILEVIKKNAVHDLTDHLNKVDETGSIKFTSESEKDNGLPFLDMLVVKKPDGHVKMMVYRKQTHTDQYLHFDSHHPIQHKLSVIRTLFDRSSIIVTEQEDCQQELQHVQTALSACCYPKWSMDFVEKQQRARDVKQAKQTKKAKVVYRWLSPM